MIHGRAPAMEAVLITAEGKVSSQFETEIGYLRGAEPVAQFSL